MKSAALDQITTYVAHESRALAKAVPAFLHGVADFARTAPANVWAMCALVAAASILVTLVTFYLWPKQDGELAPAPAVPRETKGANAVRELALRGQGASDIARQTGLSHDAVATILRARTRQSRPTAA
jgi:hypothetical protein